MKRILLFLVLSASFMFGQSMDKTLSDITSHGGGGNSTMWVSQMVFVDSGATSAGPFSADQPLIAVGVTRNAVWDSVTATPSDDYHWDSSWTASSLAFSVGYDRILNDSANTTAGITTTDSIDFLPLYDEEGYRYYVEIDSMSIAYLNPHKVAGIKYYYVEFRNSSSGASVEQAEPRTLVLFYRKY